MKYILRNIGIKIFLHGYCGASEFYHLFSDKCSQSMSSIHFSRRFMFRFHI